MNTRLKLTSSWKKYTTLYCSIQLIRKIYSGSINNILEWFVTYFWKVISGLPLFLLEIPGKLFFTSDTKVLLNT